MLWLLLWLLLLLLLLLLLMLLMLLLLVVVVVVGGGVVVVACVVAVVVVVSPPYGEAPEQLQVGLGQQRAASWTEQLGWRLGRILDWPLWPPANPTL